jgi:acetoin utilization deacetylase AcuC-like enzyme
MKTALVTDPRYLAHQPGPDHPEQPIRLRAILDAVQSGDLGKRLISLKPRPATLDEVTAVHTRQYVQRIHDVCKAGGTYVDVPDSAVCPASYEVALLAAGGVLAACDAVMTRQVHNAFCAVRPPGHHAEADRAMGFCLLNNVAIAARYLQRRHGLHRVFILDWDVHHGNGTQHLFERDGSVMYCSLHEHPGFLYPGTGYAWERGEGCGLGRILNLPMMPHAGDDEFRAAFLTRVLPTALAFGPQFVLVSAGFDAHGADPLATLDLTTEMFGWMTRQAKALARRCCQGRLVSVLEGGYDLDALKASVTAHLEALLEDDDPERLAGTNTE